MYEEEIEHPVKVLIVGNGAVGKSSMIQRYCKGIFTSEYKKTIGVDFLEKKINVNGEDLRMMIWDTAGQEEFDSMTKAYYRDAQACVVAFSTTDRDSFMAVESWIKKVEAEVGSIPMVLIQNKVDLIDKAVMTKEEAESLAEKVKLKFYRTSVQENYNVDNVFRYLAELYVASLRKQEAESAAAGNKDAKAFASAAGAPTEGQAEKKKIFSGSTPAAAQGGFKIDKPRQRTGGRKARRWDCSIL